MEATILIGIIPALHWLLQETDNLQVNLSKRKLSLFDKTVNKLLAEFDGNLETWDWKLELNYNWLRNERIARESPYHAGIHNRYPELSYNDLIQTELAYESLMIQEPEFKGELGTTNPEGVLARVASISNGDIRWAKRNR